MNQGPHAPTELIAGYAAGTLSPGMSLLVASHLSYCRCCREKSTALEAIGGALLAASEPVAPGPRCLARALARIDIPEMCDRAWAAREEPLPPLLRIRIDRPVCDLRWRPVLPGLAEFPLVGFTREAVGLMRAQPGTPMQAPNHCGRESRLVLAGQVRAGSRTYAKGDLVLPAANRERCPEAVGGESCLCLVVQPEAGRREAALH
jgi:putative transcriptional regulator